MRVVYGDKMVAELLHHISPSAFKPRLLVQHLRSAGYPMELYEPPALSREDLCLAHSPEYVDGVLSCLEPNGFGNIDPGVAASLPYTSGSLYRAGQLALEHGMAASFSSGFHHARYDGGGGFCTFNGLVIAATKLHREGAHEILILDLDFHYGDGTDNILSHLQIDFIRHETLGRLYRSRGQGPAYLHALERILCSLSERPVDLILFQAGADVHLDDPFGGVLSTEQMAARDHMVFETSYGLGIPIAWNLAGGYQRDASGTILPVLLLHEQTYRLASEIYS